MSRRAGLVNTGDDVASEVGSDAVLDSQSGSGPGVAMVTEQQQRQQQQFVEQMLQALANSSCAVSVFSTCFLLAWI